MSSQVFSREYLQSIPEQRRQAHINAIINSHSQRILNVAGEGNTSYTYVPDNRIDRQFRQTHGNLQTVVATEELIAAFQQKFPGCKVSYEENWVNTTPATKVLTTGIVIDWS